MVSAEQFVFADPTEHVIALDVVRESGWKNRYCQNVEDQVITPAHHWELTILGNSLLLRGHS